MQHDCLRIHAKLLRSTDNVTGFYTLVILIKLTHWNKLKIGGNVMLKYKIFMAVFEMAQSIV